MQYSYTYLSDKIRAIIDMLLMVVLFKQHLLHAFYCDIIHIDKFICYICNNKNIQRIENRKEDFATLFAHQWRPGFTRLVMDRHLDILINPPKKGSGYLPPQSGGADPQMISHRRRRSKTN